VKDGYFHETHFAKPSNTYGAGVEHSDSQISRSMMHVETPGEVARKKGEGLYVAAEAPPSQAPPIRQAAHEVLASYNHEQKPENPIYTTTNNSIGSKRPDMATFTNDRVSIPQAFSNSFQGAQYRDQGLSTALTKSNFHAKLDPSFN